jgi:acetate kinase
VKVLVVNVGSSTIKLRVIQDGRACLGSFDVDVESESGVATAIDEALSDSGTPDAVGHRIVHGGTTFRGPTLLDGTVIDQLEQLDDLAPLHQRRGLDGVALVQELLPRTPAVGCFDTAFFADLPARAATYALPKKWRERFGLRRFGFHGLSHSYAAERASRMLGSAVRHRLVTCHLGSGSSLAAIRDGVPVDTTMGFTPLEGIVMSTRSGSVDPGMVLWLQSQAGLDLSEVSDGLEHHSGLLGLAGTADMRAVLADAASGTEEARLARDVYIHRLRGGIAAMAAAMDGMDALVFTGGVGENAPEVRSMACAGLSHLDVHIDEHANTEVVSDARVHDEASRVAILLVASREDLEIASQVERLLGA